MRRFGGIEVGLEHVIDWLTAHPERTAILSVVLGLSVGGTVLSLAEEEVTLVDGIWWAFVSMTTVGYGDIAPVRPLIRMLATFVILCGIVATAILVGEITGRIAQRRIADADRTEVLHDDLAAAAKTLERVVPRLRALELDDADDPESWGRVRAIADRLGEGVSDPVELEALARELRGIARHELRR